MSSKREMKLYMAKHAGEPMFYAENNKAYWYQANRACCAGTLETFIALGVVRESTSMEFYHARADLYLKATNPSKPYPRDANRSTKN